MLLAFFLDQIVGRGEIINHVSGEFIRAGSRLSCVLVIEGITAGTGISIIV